LRSSLQPNSAIRQHVYPPASPAKQRNTVRSCVFQVDLPCIIPSLGKSATAPARHPFILAAHSGNSPRLRIRICAPQSTRSPFRTALLSPSLFAPLRAPAGDIALATVRPQQLHRRDAPSHFFSESHIERFAPGFRDCTLALRIFSRRAWKTGTQFIGGDIYRRRRRSPPILFRPPGDITHPIRNLDLCSSSTPPGLREYTACAAKRRKQARNRGAANARPSQPRPLPRAPANPAVLPTDSSWHSELSQACSARWESLADIEGFTASCPVIHDPQALLPARHIILNKETFMS